MKRRQTSGQSLVEYVILIMIISGLGSLLYSKLVPFFGVLEARLQTDFKFTYKLGDPQARGPEDTNGPSRHPRIFSSGNFRMFGRGT